MRKLLNTLYVTNPDIYLTKDGENIVAKIEQKEVMRIPAINLEGIVCFNRMGPRPILWRCVPSITLVCASLLQKGISWQGW